MAGFFYLVQQFRQSGRFWRALLAGVTSFGVFLAVGAAAEPPVQGDAPSSAFVTDEPALLDSTIWLEQMLIAQADSASDAALRQIPPRPPTLPSTPAAPVIDEPRPLPDDLLAPTTPAPPRIAPVEDTRFTLFRRSRARANFARRRRPIAVLGDSLVDTGQLEVNFSVQDPSTWPPTPLMASASSDIPLIALATRRRISKNSSVLPTDRLITSYQHFHNALAAEVSHPLAGDVRATKNLDRMTFGIEKTFFDGQWSLDARFPVLSRFDFATTDFGLTNGRLGNASLVLKHICFETETTVWGAGVGIDFPTGSNGQLELPSSEVTIFNDAYHALPYIGLLMTPTENTVIQGFAQLDIPLNGNEVEVQTASGTSLFGQFDEQELLFLSVSAAHWLYQNPEASHLRGLASLLELHYTTLLEDSERVELAEASQNYVLTNSDQRINYLNMALGLQAQVGTTELRIAAVLPLLQGVNRPFDAEAMVQINRHF